MRKLVLFATILNFSIIFSQSRYSQEPMTYEKGKLKEIQVSEKGSERVIKFDYNDKGQRTDSKMFNIFGDKIFEAKKLYENTKDLSQIWYDDDGKVKQKSIYKYDTSNRLNKIYRYFGGKDNYLYTKYKYDGKKISDSHSYFMVGGKKYDLSQINEFISEL